MLHKQACKLEMEETTMKVPIAVAITVTLVRVILFLSWSGEKPVGTTDTVHVIVNGPGPASIVVDEGEPVGSL